MEDNNKNIDNKSNLENKAKNLKKENTVLIPILLVTSVISIIFIPTNIIICLSSLTISIILGILLALNINKIYKLNENIIDEESYSSKMRNEKTRKVTVQNEKIKTLKTNELKTKSPKSNHKLTLQLPKPTLELTLTEKLSKELKSKRILFYIFLAITSILLIIETLLLYTIILSIIAYPLLIPTITSATITIILNNEVRNIKFQINLNKIINRDTK